MNSHDVSRTQESAKYEWQAFLFIAVLFFPLLSIVLVGSYGFIIWMLQVFVIGPPGHG